MRSTRGWALAPTGSDATKAGRDRPAARGRRGRIAGAAITAILAATLASGSMAPAYAALAGGVGPVDPVTGFPMWYDDGPVRLSLCDQGVAAGCLVPLPNEAAPKSFPDNYADEAFWFFAAAGNDAQPALYEAALEAAFINGPIVNGDQQSFSRLRFRLDSLTPGQSYVIAHPYGSDTFVADPVGVINETIDNGCVAAPCNFASAGVAFQGDFAAGATATFLTQANATPGMLGNLNVPGTVTGAPSGLNAVTVTGPNAGGPGVNTFTVNQFVVQGRLVGPATVAARPIIRIATAGNGSAVGNWTAPENGGSAITKYHVRVVDAATGTRIFALRDVPAAVGKSANSLNVTGLPNGIAFRFQVQAINAQGVGPVSNHSNSVTPATVPSRPTIRIATAGIASGTGNWAAAANGGAVITRYHVRVVDAATGTKVFVLRDVPGSARSLSVALPRGIALRFQVQAINRVGPSLLSNPSNAVTAR